MRGNRRRTAEELRTLEMGKGPIKLAGLHPEGLISSEQPCTLPETIVGKRGPVAVSLLPIPGGGLEKRCPGSLPGTVKTTDEHLGRRYADLFLLLWEQRGLISQGSLKR